MGRKKSTRKRRPRARGAPSPWAITSERFDYSDGVTMETHYYRPVLPADPKQRTREIIAEVAKRKAEKRCYQRELAARFFRKGRAGRFLTPEESRSRLRTFVSKHRKEIERAARQYSKRQ